MAVNTITQLLYVVVLVFGEGSYQYICVAERAKLTFSSFLVNKLFYSNRVGKSKERGQFQELYTNNSGLVKTQVEMGFGF
jgi:hypothetical protein